MTVTSEEQPLTIGPFVINDVPPPLRYQFLEDDGVSPVDLSDFTNSHVSFWHRRSRTTTETERTSATIVDAAEGIVEYVWVAADFTTAGTYRARFVADNTVNEFKSVLLVYEVKAFL